MTEVASAAAHRLARSTSGPVLSATVSQVADDGELALENIEVIEDALLEGDRVFVPGSARSAWQSRTFRRIYLGAFASNIGTWMQNVVLGALAYELTGSAVFVGVMMVAQLGPLLLFSTLGGMLADSVDRKKLLISLTVEQGVLSSLLGFVAFADHPNKALMVGIVALIGIGNALYAPVFSALLPVLVPRATSVARSR